MSVCVPDKMTGRSTGWAIVLSVACPGLGQLYCGHFVRSLVYAIAANLPAVLSLMVLVFSRPTVLPLAYGLAVASTIVSVVALCDAYVLARRYRTYYELKEYNRWYVYVLLLILVSISGVGMCSQIRDRFFDVFSIPTAAMQPTIHVGERIIVDKTAYQWNEPSPGDIVVFISPENHRMFCIRRVAAVAGDTVQIHGDEIHVNRRVDGDRANATQVAPATFPALPTTADMIVPKGSCFVLGDNRKMSVDSRQFGCVPIALIVGRAEIIYGFSDGHWRFHRISAR